MDIRGIVIDMFITVIAILIQLLLIKIGYLLSFRITNITIEQKSVSPSGVRKKPTKVKVHSQDGDADFFDIVAGVLQGHTLAPCLFINCRDYGCTRYGYRCVYSCHSDTDTTADNQSGVSVMLCD